MTSTVIDYVGDELTLFASAHNWKRYLRGAIAAYISGNVAEVGAGLGATTRALAGVPGVTHWTCIEPDPAMIAQISETTRDLALDYPVEAKAGTLADFPREPRFDTILYIDVLEHIEDDRAELIEAVLRLRPGGRIVVLAPAWPRLYSPFDTAVGHFRRYTRTMLRHVAPPGTCEAAAFYLDSVGMMASVANTALLAQRMPTARQIAMWDRLMVPLSRLLDPIVFRTFGKSVVIVWSRV